MDVAFVQHSDDCGPAMLGDVLSDTGVPFSVCRADLGEPLPALDTPGVIVLGGAMGATDDARAPWLPNVRAMLAERHNHGRKTLGICLGHQLLAVALGGKIGKNPSGPTIGVAAQQAVLEGWPVPDVATHWNDDVVTDLPPTAQVVGKTADGAPSMIHYGRATVGTQFHPEAGLAVLRLWADDEDDAERLAALGIDVEQAVSQAKPHEEPLRATAHHLATWWLAS